MKKKLVKVVRWVMLVVFLIGVAPNEYLHEVLYHHTDTVHPVYKKGEIVIGDKHTHCTFLGFAFAPFAACEKQLVSFREVASYTHYLEPEYCFHFSSAHNVLSLEDLLVVVKRLAGHTSGTSFISVCAVAVANSPYSRCGMISSISNNYSKKSHDV